jgi:hypothetical protein
MRSEYIARSQLERRACERTKVDLVPEFHGAAGTRSGEAITLRVGTFPPDWRNINFR